MTKNHLEVVYLALKATVVIIISFTVKLIANSSLTNYFYRRTKSARCYLGFRVFQ